MDINRLDSLAENLDRLADQDLLVIIATDAEEKLESGDDSLVLSFSYNKTAENIEKGKRVLRDFISDTKGRICAAWLRSKKGRFEPTVSRTELILLVFHATHSEGLAEPLTNVARAILVCRACAWSLDKFCSDASREHDART